MIAKRKTEITSSQKQTLAQVVDRLRESSGTKYADEQRSAIRTFARVAGQPLDTIDADRRLVVDLLNRSSPARHGVSQPRWRNVRSLVLAALDTVSKTQRGQLIALSQEWRDLLAPLPDKPLRLQLMGFARFCSGARLEPGDVTENTFERYGQHLLNRSSRSSPRAVYLGLCRVWLQAADQFAHWPTIRPQVDDLRDWYTLPWSSFPASLKADVDAMLKLSVNPDPLTGVAVRPLRRISAQGRERAIRAFASALVRRGCDARMLRSLADLIEPERAAEGLRFFMERMGQRRSAYLRDFARLLVIIARHWVHSDPPRDEAERMTREHLMKRLEGFRRNLAPQRIGMTIKNRTTLRQFEDEELVGRLLALPNQIWSRYPKTRSLKISELVKLQGALAIAILTSVPIRRKNLLEIKIGENLIPVGPEAGGRMHLHFEACEVKNDAEIEFELPAQTVRFIERYLKEVRPHLAQLPSPYLFVGSRGVKKIDYIFSNQIADLTASELGVRITPHQFRHIAGFLYLKANPGGHEVVRRLLGHKSIQTTLDFYAGMEVTAAHQHYDRLISAQRDRWRSEGRSSGRRQRSGDARAS